LFKNFISVLDYFDVEDDILCVIAEELGGVVPFIGGKEYYKYVLGPLEQLCSVEEVLVAEKVFFFYMFWNILLV
jgi:hypothetical protein